MEPETMYALVKERADKGLTLKKVPVPEAGPGDVKIKIHYTSICGTDLHIYNWDKWSQETIRPGTVIGHEFVGEVAELGSGVSGFSVGDIVSGEGHIVCGHCRNCKAGKRHLCKQTKGVGVNRDGAFAEYLVIPQTNAIRCEPGIPEELCSSFDPLGHAGTQRSRTTCWRGRAHQAGPIGTRLRPSAVMWAQSMSLLRT
ncbi:alcohol dehydrogenase catalytic domain-containing protein [Ruthenibacterium lactatiformans]|uniref:alcohol dehydrogenase catalytic domain-containing protein n=1 Tax=Ruthenibacterium lactatiformans TaxID=1550024 RepID=UPI0039A15553